MNEVGREGMEGAKEGRLREFGTDKRGRGQNTNNVAEVIYG